MRLLVVEDEEDLADALRFGLTRAGFAVDVALTGAQAEERLGVNAYDVVVLDLNLPDTDGVDLLRQLRSGGFDGPSGSDTRVLLLTARSSLDHRVRGLDAGADDYLVKPFAFEELQARLRALLRREVAGGDVVLRSGPVELDTARRLAFRDGRELKLTNKELGVLEYLLRHPGHVVSSEDLLEHVWDENADPFTQTVRVTVGTLRRKLSLDDEEQLLETLVGQGYRLRTPTGPTDGG
ncbi:response regulator transcription factor [Motilibacter deserti]|uniref:Response regulator transcription factor n=1 Tax=Motilibacter deserti TaxID=2714956 RepID=A0ABX0GNY8_9ACTN|nr:response regulator transcription factor [Motilibacter deserti]NHC12553.1 response regulator transcription factor [Motilibacter deserti]